MHLVGFCPPAAHLTAAMAGVQEPAAEAQVRMEVVADLVAVAAQDIAETVIRPPEIKAAMAEAELMAHMALERPMPIANVLLQFPVAQEAMGE